MTAADSSLRLWRVLGPVTLLLVLAGVCVGSDGWTWLPAAWQDLGLASVVTQIRLPRTVGAWAVGALLGLAGAIAQGLFRNPLADPYLLGSAAGASLAVVAVLAATAAGAGAVLAGSAWTDVGLAAAAFGGALGGLALTLLLARGAASTPRLLLAGVVVGVMLTAVGDLLAVASPQALRGRQSFLLGHTGYLGWEGVALLLPALAVSLAVAVRLSRGLDALALGEESARSLGLDLPRLRGALIATLALATGLAVAQAGLIAFVGLVAPHLVRRFGPARHGPLLAVSAAMGGTLLLAADVGARALLAPQELPVGVLTAVLGGGYLLWLLHRRAGGQGEAA